MGTRRTTRRRRSAARRRRKVILRRRLLFIGTVLILFVFVSVLVQLIKSEKKSYEKAYVISEACEAYRSQVEETAPAYGMEEYVDLIMAVMMQESSGLGTDVMQSSECQYNTRYPRQPNGITDVSYSIECGIQELHHALVLAEVKGPDDIAGIKLALQGYNFGADSYLSYMKEKNEDEWSHETAAAFAQMASGNTLRQTDDSYYETAGKWAYGDQYYPEHVLRYYPYVKS